ncbi:T9SS type A sorting domain-containing protein [Haliscomenobacter sp.]|uniref:T9SS type A sorting domain-containing protein n=1 Tax=Haliscomenobacter sp. TaxID=2717303 RepID=UPI003364DE53
MKKYYYSILLIFVALALPGLAFAQKPNYQWAAKIDISDSDITDEEGGPLIEMLVDQQGNSYLLGGFQEGLQLDAQTHLQENPDSLYQFFLAKYNAKGKLEWYRTIRESEFGSVNVYDMVLDAQGQVILGGTSSADTVYLGRNDYLTSSCGADSFCEDLFLVKFSTQGDVAWGRQMSTAAGYFYDLRLNLDLQDNLLLTFLSYRADSIFIAGQTIKNVPKDAIFACKMDPNGKLKWYRQGNQIDADLELLDVSAQRDGSSWVLGTYAYGDKVDFGDGFSLQSLPKIDPFYDQTYLIKHAADGDIEWLSELNSDILYARMVAGKNGDIYIVGSYSEILYYNGRVVLSDIGINPNPEEDYTTFILKIDSDGKIIWKKQLPQVIPLCLDYILDSSFLPFRSWSVDAAGRLLMPLYYLAYEPTTLQVADRTIELPITYVDDEDSMYEWGGLARIEPSGKLDWVADFPLDSVNHFYPHFVRPGPDESFYLEGAMYIDTLRLSNNILVTEDYISSVLTRFDMSVAIRRPSPGQLPFPYPRTPIGQSKLNAPLDDQIGLQLYPNPVEARLELTLQKPLDINLLLVRDALGRVVWRMAGQENFRGATIIVQNFVPGLYVVELQTARGNQSLKFIKK